MTSCFRDRWVDKVLAPLKYNGVLRPVIEVFLDLILLCILNIPNVRSITNYIRWDSRTLAWASLQELEA